jgi:hypothetical protein
MKQLPMTPELAALIKKRVGDDVDPAKLAVFEAIALNTKPLVGKDGTIFERAVTMPVTLAQMVDYINSGKHLPVIHNHDLDNVPTGRFFHADLFSDDNSLDELEMRALFYLDSTEDKLIAKLNDASIDEVSVSFLASAFLCSECGWDYFSQGAPENIATRTCANGHTIGEDGVHAEMIGLNKFIELSLVARGAADTPKIVGKSQSKVAPDSAYRLAAKGFELNDLVVKASMGKEEDMDTTKLVTDLAERTGEVAVLKADVTRITGERDALTTQLGEKDTKISELETQLAAAKEEKPEDYDSAKTERDEAVALLQEQLNGVRVALGETKLEGDALPTKIADLKVAIEDKTGKLTALLPTDGVSTKDKSNKDEAKVDLSGFKTNK